MRHVAPLLLLLLPSAASAAWPEDVDISRMTTFGDEVQLDRDVLADSYKSLVTDLGTMIANKPMLPAETLGIWGFAFDTGLQWALTEAQDREGEPSPWDRVHPDEDAGDFHVIPTFSVRKGLPLSTEIGSTVGWIGGSSTGSLAVFGRVAVLEGYKPAPDITLQLGYSGYVGNDELDAGTLDLGVTLGSKFPVGSLVGVHTAHISPWATFQTLRVSANPNLDPDTEAAIGAIRFQRSKTESYAAPLVVPQFGAGVQFTSDGVHARLSAAWAPSTFPTIATGFGCTF